MYYDINQVLGIKISDNVGKSLTSAVMTNLTSAGAQIGATAVSEGAKFIPFVGWIASAAISTVTSTAIVYGAAYLYLTALTKMYEADGKFDIGYLESMLDDQTSEGCIFEKSYCQIGTLGHVDHGKTTLSAAITTVLAKNGFSEVKSFNQIDNAPLLKNHNVTMRAARVEYETGCRRYSHVDCPNHSDYVKSLVTGTVHLDGAILVVSATDGPMPQTREHVLLARQLNVQRLVVFLNKCDLVEDDEMLDLVEMEVQEILAQYEFEDDTPIIRGSALGALNGIAKWEQKVMDLMDACDAWIPNSLTATNKPFLMPVEDVFSITGRGTVVTGRIESGVIYVGDEVELIGLGEKKKSVVTGVEMFRKILDQGEAGDNVGLLLRGLNQNDVIRGMVLCHPGQIKQSKKFKASMYACRPEENGRATPFGNKYRPQFYFRTMDLTGEIYLPKGVEMVMPGDNVENIVELIYPIPLEDGLNFSVHEGKYTVGFGVVTEVF
jgi:elongation factor Tu